MEKQYTKFFDVSQFEKLNEIAKKYFKDATHRVKLSFNAWDEHIPVEQSFDECNPENIKKNLRKGNVVYFSAEVNVYFGKSEGTTHLGCCLYNSYEDFLEDDYFYQLFEEACQSCLTDYKSCVQFVEETIEQVQV